MEGKIKFLVRFGILAPSSHNTQPWKFRIKDNTLELFADFSRRLPKSDEDGRMIYAALGCAISNIKIALDYYSLNFDIEYNRELGNSPEGYVAKITFRGKGDVRKYPAEFLYALMRRHSYRGRYRSKSIPSRIFENIAKLNENDFEKFDIIKELEKKEEIAQIMGRAMKNKMAKREFRWELAHWLRTNITQRSDGMPGNGHGMKLITSILAPFILRLIDVSAVEKKKAIRRVRNFPAIGLISTPIDSPRMWIAAGEYLERILIYLYSQNIAASIMIAPVEHMESRNELKKFTEFLPQIFFGFGYAEKTYPHSPRRKLAEIFI